MIDGVAPDGSPVAVFATLPPRGIPELLHGAIATSGTVLELGCGAGRLAHGLIALGHQVTAVDNSPEMLAEVRGAECIEADLFALDLARRFDAVVAGSYLVNSWPEGLLATCGRHLAPTGVALVQRYEPSWAREASPGSATVGRVTITIDPITCVEDHLVATVTYVLGAERWTQQVDALVLDDEGLDAYAHHAGLRVDGYLDEYREWARLTRDEESRVEGAVTDAHHGRRRKPWYRRA